MRSIEHILDPGVSNMKAIAVFLVFIASMLGFTVLFTVLGWLFLEIAPCHWFGSGFEGACGYRAVFFTFIAGVTLTLIFSFSYTMRFIQQRSDEGCDQGQT
ncbi:hypothetical protein [Azonexus sp.]|jgi:hypothetical protein|uniref:hypothetical protein n=1 Tax=Azonexus sp. TaxID=1872668 RepID=UPI002816BAE9|nr:hypothetical protein [Azonexus sp.]MDR1994171.1 hypothetical protein [Azonexus sp.]